MKYFPICFLLLMTCLVRVENVPIPGDCTTKPYREKGGKNENQDVRLHLDCTLSAINSESEKTNFSVIPGEHTASLTVRCSDTLSTSHIEPQGFLSLNLLEELEIIGCKLENIPDHAFLGLTRLRVLRLESSTTTPLSLDPGSMSGIGSLEHLDISERELELLHPSALCSLPSLSSLKLEGGSFSSLENLGKFS
ncbi:toll-like receptor 6 [Eurytemora carolleeae]|uniref:toll-like receptor 6 n=1 Tax=Eurytemora carolleeae TaxID=1294199 RepID=UPI000C789C92|nr:toll-like receptor 6 [Eurytemora carolleeae]|eukprot:XP_023321221.1 toll-like receptor 6 [Eurytemora affinis]